MAAPPVIDLRQPRRPWSVRRAAGRALRKSTPRASHATWSPAADRPDPVEQLDRADQRRDPATVAVRVQRMAASPFGYFRGAADMMAADLLQTPRTGVTTQLCGDAHCMNFGFYGAPSGEVVFDVNDFDETAVGPWEWDLKRLATSIVLAGQSNGASRKECRRAVRRAIEDYRQVMWRSEDLGVQDLWRVVLDQHSPLVEQVGHDDRVFRRGFVTALEHQDRSTLPKLTAVVAGHRQFEFRPPLLERLDATRREEVVSALERYAATTLIDAQTMLGNYHVVDAARKVVGVGSVGTNDLVALLEGEGGHDPLFIQLKQAVPSDVRLALGDPAPAHEGERVVRGQRLMQAVSDRLLGWTSIGDVPYYVRRLKDLKAAMPIDSLHGSTLEDYGSMCAAILAQSHGRNSDPAMIAGYCGRSARFDDAIAEFALVYSEQVERDHAAIVEAVRSGRLQAAAEED
jgi:uncharacterized protein (DUF2252 family)